MSGHWSLQRTPVRTKLEKQSGYPFYIIEQPLLLHPTRRAWVCGAHGSILPGHLTSSSNSINSSNGGAAAAKAAAALASRASPVAHVLAPHAHSSRPAWSSDSAQQEQQQRQVDQVAEQQQQQLLLQQQQQVEHKQLLVHSLGAAYRVVQAQHAHSPPAVASGNGCVSNSSSGSGDNTAVASDQAASFNNSTSNLHSRRLGSIAVNASVGPGYITCCLKRCTCWQELDVVVQEYGPAFNIIHISAAITHLAQLSSSGSKQQQQQEQRHPQRQKHQQQQQSEQEGRQLVMGIQLVAEQMNRQHQQLQVQLGQQQQHQQKLRDTASLRRAELQEQQQQQLQLVHQMVERAVPLLHAAGSRQVANMLWALAQLHFTWQATPAAAAATMALVNRAAELFSSAEGQHLSNISYAAAKLQLPVSQTWLAGLQEAWLQHVLLQQQQQCSQSSRSSSRISSNSSGGTPQGRQAVASAAGVSVSPQAAANMVWALTHLHQQRQPLSTAWLDQMVAGVASSLASWPARSVAVLLWGCAKLGYKARGQAASAALQQQQHCTTQQDLAQEQQQQQQRSEEQQLDGSKQQQQQDVPLLLLQAVQTHSQSFSSQDVSQVLWAAAAMGLQLPAPMLQQLLAAGGAKLQPQQQSSSSSASSNQATAQSVALVLHSLAKLGVVPQQQLPPHLLRPWLAALLFSCAAADSHCLTSAAWALCTLGLASSCPLLVKALMQAATQRLQQHRHTLHMQPPAAAAAAASRSSALSSRALASLLWAAAYCVPAAPAISPAVSKPVWQHGTRAGQQLQLSRAHQQQYLKQRQQQRLMLMLQGMRQAQHGSTAPQQGSAAAAASSRPTPSATAGGSTGKDVPPHGAIHAAAMQLLLAAANMDPHPQQQQQGDDEQPQQDTQQERHAAAAAVLPGASLFDMSQLLWAVSRLNLRLPEPWWQACLLQFKDTALQTRRLLKAAAQNRCVEPADQQQLQQQQLAQSAAVAVWATGRVWALRMTELRMPRQLIRELTQTSQPFLQQQQQQQGLGSLSGQGHVMLLVGLVRLCAASGHQLRSHDYQRGSSSSKHYKWRRRYREHRCGVVWVRDTGLDPAWLQTFCASAAVHLHALPPTGIVALLWGLAKLRYHPGSSFLAAALQRVQQQQAQMNARHIALLLWSLQRLQHVPGEPLLGVLLEAWEQRLASASTADRQQVQYVQQQLWRLQCMQEWCQAQQQQRCEERSVVVAVQGAEG